MSPCQQNLSQTRNHKMTQTFPVRLSALTRGLQHVASCCALGTSMGECA